LFSIVGTAVSVIGVVAGDGGALKLLAET